MWMCAQYVYNSLKLCVVLCCCSPVGPKQRAKDNDAEQRGYRVSPLFKWAKSFEHQAVKK